MSKSKQSTANNNQTQTQSSPNDQNFEKITIPINQEQSDVNMEQTQQKQYEFYVPRNYARSMIQPLWATAPNNSATRLYKTEQIGRFLLHPYNSYKELQNISNYLLYTSSAYNNFLDYLSNSLTFDYILQCEDTDKVNKATIEKRYIESAKIVHKINVKSIFPALLKRVLTNGETYFYNMSDSNNSIIVEIDSNICQLAQIDNNNIWRYYVNLSLIDSTKAYELPEEIYNAYKNWVDGGKSKEKKEIDGITVPNYLYLVSDKGFAIFVHMRKTQHDYPYLAHMFEDLNDLESDKSYMNEFIKNNNIKLIHQKIPTNSETGMPLMDKDIIQSYHDSAKEHLPSMVAPLTNPFEIQSLSLDKSQSTAINLVEHSTKVVMQDSGISDTIFNANSTNGLKYATLADSTKLYCLLYFFENFVNLQIKQYKCKIKFLRINYYNQLEWHERYYADVQAGGSRSLFVCTGGLEPYDMINVSKTEKVLGIDDLLEPKVNSSQMSGKEENKNGRPNKKEDDKSDSTVVVDGYR
jgi:hypothetical protein